MEIIIEKVRIRPKYDTSTKEYEVQSKFYSFTDRKLTGRPQWGHTRYYTNLQSAIDAIRDFRKYKTFYYKNKAWLYRFRIVKREFI